MFTKLSIGLLALLGASVNGQYLCGNVELSSSNDMSVALLIDANMSMVYVSMEGPSTQYFAVGFGSTMMSGTYAIIVDGDGDTDATVTERTLGASSGSSQAGTVLTSSVTVVEDSVTDGVRYIQLSRAIMNSNYDFEIDTSDDQLSVIWATATDAVTLTTHTAKGSKTIDFDNSATGTGVVCTLMDDSSDGGSGESGSSGEGSSNEGSSETGSENSGESDSESSGESDSESSGESGENSSGNGDTNGSVDSSDANKLMNMSSSLLLLLFAIMYCVY